VEWLCIESTGLFLHIGGDVLNKDEFIEELDKALGEIHQFIEEKHKISFATNYEGEITQYTFEFSDEDGYSSDLADMFINRLREYVLQVYDTIVEEKIDENPDPMSIIVTILQLVAHEFGDVEE